MAFKIVRRIRDNVHGTVEISELEDLVIAHPYIQRLRRIKQLAFLSYVFPGASHTRFAHSLGVMHLADVAWQKIKANQERFRLQCTNIKDFSLLEKTTDHTKEEDLLHGLLAPTFSALPQIFGCDYTLQVIRLAALMHDLGHPPFSHSGERFLPSWPQLVAENGHMPDYIIEFLNKNIELSKSLGKDPEKVAVSHEIISVLMVVEILRDIYSEHPHLELRVDPRDIISIISPIAPSAASPLVKYSA